ncbi:MAG: hypothetical protein J0H01_36210 [Rhizobiales bacterium]|nr:hypothetical protein [Hyphomicrobiales bacterium]
MPLIDVDVVVRWDEGIRNLHPLEEELASSEDGILLNLAYCDYRGATREDAIEAIEEEADLLVELEAADWNTDAAEEAIEANIGAMGPTGALDPGVAGLVFAISALGGTPISSCNGGLVGISHHTSDVPHVLFTGPPELIDRILPAAKRHRVGLIHNEGYAEAFTNHLPNLHAFARELIGVA